MIKDGEIEEGKQEPSQSVTRLKCRISGRTQSRNCCRLQIRCDHVLEHFNRHVPGNVSHHCILSSNH